MSDVNEAEMGQLEDGVGGMTLTVIDTPGFLATQRRCRSSVAGESNSDTDVMLQEFSRALVYAKDGVDAVLVTLRCAEPASMEEEALLEFLTEMQIWKHCIVLFTHGARVSDGKDEGYLELYKALDSGELAKECPVLSKFVENCERRFIVIESVERAGDKHYYRSKLDELYGAVETTCKNAKSAFNHPLLEMAKNSYQIIQMQKRLREEADDKEAQLEATIRDMKAVNERLDIAEKRCTNLQNALESDSAEVGVSDEQDIKDAAAMLLEYLRASEATEASPAQFVSAIRRLETAERKQREMMGKLGELLEGIKAEKRKRLPREELERDLESILRLEQERDEQVQANAPEGQRDRKDEKSWCNLL